MAAAVYVPTPGSARRPASSLGQPLQATTRAAASKLRARVVIDGRNLYNPEHIAAAGLHYRGIGLRHVAPQEAAK